MSYNYQVSSFEERGIIHCSLYLIKTGSFLTFINTFFGLILRYYTKQEDLFEYL